MCVREQVIHDSFSGTLECLRSSSHAQGTHPSWHQEKAVPHGTDLSGAPGRAPDISTSKLLHTSKEGLQPSAVLGWANSQTQGPPGNSSVAGLMPSTALSIQEIHP